MLALFLKVNISLSWPPQKTHRSQRQMTSYTGTESDLQWTLTHEKAGQFTCDFPQWLPLNIWSGKGHFQVVIWQEVEGVKEELTLMTHPAGRSLNCRPRTWVPSPQHRRAAGGLSCMLSGSPSPPPPPVSSSGCCWLVHTTPVGTIIIKVGGVKNKYLSRTENIFLKTYLQKIWLLLFSSENQTEGRV